MKLGLMFANTVWGASAEGAVAIAQAAEAGGFESIWTVEHVVVPSGYESKYPYDPSGKMAGGAEEFDLPDPLIWLSYVAARTSTIKLGTGILILPQRNPLIVAKELASLDALSGGRMICGIGVGWLEEEFDALGVPFHDRGARCDDTVDVLRKAWTGQKVSHASAFTTFTDCISLPRPANGTVPIVVGGDSPAAARRAGRLGDGYFPGNGAIDHLRGRIDIMRRAAGGGPRPRRDRDLGRRRRPQCGRHRGPRRGPAGRGRHPLDARPDAARPGARHRRSPLRPPRRLTQGFWV
ncbi:MAG: LLM class F420-dependent oxidoreductase [Ilumatobacteraceae bacterium]